MLPMFKQYCKDALVGGTIGASIGSAAGSAAGKVGINQSCIEGFPNNVCDYIFEHANQQAIQAGALTGAAVGFGIGITLYPMYKAFCRFIRGQESLPRYQQNVELEVIRDELVDKPMSPSRSAWNKA